MILALQGGMAAGKTTAAAFLEAHLPQLQVFYEDNRAVLAEVGRRGLDKTRYPDYLEIQRLWLRDAVRRYQAALAFPNALLDYGPEEILFYTLHYPPSVGKDWEVAGPLAPELEAARRCLPDRILFLDASEETLRRRKEADPSRGRGFFDHYLAGLHPAKRAWFRQMDRVDWLPTDSLTPEQTGRAVLAWARRQLSL